MSAPEARPRWPGEARGNFLRFTLALASLLVAGCAVNRPLDVGYRGFTVDDSACRELASLGETRTATREQIEKVCAVGVPAGMLQFFKTVPVKVVPNARLGGRGSPALYGADGTVVVRAEIVAARHKPVLLHELLHAYQDQRLAGGFRNQEILGLFEPAKSSRAFPPSHMMQNSTEFFACAGTTYLYGVTAQEPFERGKIADKQPELYAFLEKLFGPNAGNYNGSLTR